MILQLGRSPEEGSGNPLQYCCLENSTDRGAQWALCSWRRKELDMTEQLTITIVFKSVRMDETKQDQSTE